MSSQHIYDVPGPVARRRYALMAVATVVVVGAIVAFIIYRFSVTGQFSARKWSAFTYPQVWSQIGLRTLNTLKAFGLSAVLALIVGLLLAVGRLSDHQWVKVPVVWFLEIFRAIPVLILMMLMYYGMPTLGLKFTTFTSVVTALTLYNGTILAEAIRSGILALPRGQWEAAAALGLRKTSVMTMILLPQAIRAMLPVIIAQLVVILKDTALGFIITYPELLDYAKFIGTQAQFDSPLIPAAMVVGAIYVGMCLTVAGLAKIAEESISGTKGPDGKKHGWRNTNLQIARTRVRRQRRDGTISQPGVTMAPAPTTGPAMVRTGTPGSQPAAPATGPYVPPTRHGTTGGSATAPA